MSARVLLVDDHPMWLKVVEATLTAEGFTVVGTADTVRKAITIAPAVRPDIAIVDLTLPDGTGDEVAAALTHMSPPVTVLMLSASGEPGPTLRATAAGASGFLVKSASDEELIHAVRATLNGEAVFTPGLAALVLGDLRGAGSNLSERETEVLRMVARGLTSKQIAEKLFLSPRTVENHVNSTLKKLHLKNRVELARYAVDKGLD